MRKKTNKIKAIVFDAGGVLLDLNLERCRNAFKDILGYNRIDELLDPCLQKGIYGDMEEGRITSEEFRRQVLAESKPGSTPEMVDACMAALLDGIVPEKVTYLNLLKERYPLYLLSNNNEIAWACFHTIFRRDGIPIPETFKDCFLSYRMGLLKPNPEIFLKVIESLGLQPDEILYIDDSRANAVSAARVGMNSLYYKRGSDLEQLVEGALKKA